MDETVQPQGIETMSRREREKAAHRQEILEAAEEVFAEKGFEKATVEDVAHAAEFSVGALYKFFSGKEELWMEVIARIARDFLEQFRQAAAAHADPLVVLQSLIQIKLEHHQNHGAFLRVFLGSVYTNQIVASAVNPRRCCCLYDEYLDEAALVIQKAMDQGLLRPGDPMLTLLTLEGMVHAFKSFWNRRGMDMPNADQIRLIKQYFLDPLIIQQGE